MKKLIPLLALIAATSLAHGATVTSLVGDEDGFGQGTLPDGVVNYVAIAGQAGEAANTDTWMYGTHSWTHTYDLSGLGPLSSASLTVFAGGLGWGSLAQLYIGAQLIGDLSDGDDVGPDYNYAKLNTFDLTPYLGLLNGSTTFTVQAPSSGDGWVLDFARLEVSDSGQRVPDASTTIFMLGAAMLSLAAFKRRVTA